MDDSNPVASMLQTCFGDEDYDDRAFDELTAQLAAYPEQAGRFRAQLDLLVASGDEAEAVSAVEAFANRDVRASGARALAWLDALRRRLAAVRPS